MRLATRYLRRSPIYILTLAVEQRTLLHYIICRLQGKSAKKTRRFG